MDLKKELVDFKNALFDRHSKRSYSQEGEDMILSRLFEGKTDGFYVDVGAHHPMRFSNTYFFYKRGWKGINIDAMPGGMRSFQKYRPRDVNLELGISKEKTDLVYHMFNDPALNGFDRELSDDREKKFQQYKILKRVNIKTSPLSDVLHQYLPLNQSIDFLSIDVEGLDLAVLQSNDWERFKPKVVLVELLGADLADLGQHPAVKLLSEKGYGLYAKTVNTFFFKLK